MEIKFLQRGKMKLGYYDFGIGKTLVFFHGFGAEVDENYVSTFQKHYGGRVIFPIYPGYKGSGRWRKKYSVSNIIDCLHGLLDDIGAMEFDLIGHSFGSIVASEFAKKYPDMVRKVILVGAPTKNSPLFKRVKKYRRIVPIARFRVGGKVVGAVAKVALRKDKEKREMVLGMIRGFSSKHDRRALANNASEILKTDFEKIYKEVPKELLFIYGDKDNAGIANDCLGFSIKIIPGGHSVFFDNPEEFFETVKKYLGFYGNYC